MISFFLLAVGVIYSYFLYPIVLVLMSKRFNRSESSNQGDLPSVTLIITAYNEESRIGNKLENALSVDYPKDKLEILVASDCSDDGTDEIVKSYAGQGVGLVRASARLGKENAQREAIEVSKGEVLVFSDVATEMPKESLEVLASYFVKDPSIGAVSSEDRFVSQGGEVAGEGVYVKYEMWLRALESKLSGIVGLSGSFFAARKEVCDEWDIHSPSDFNTALNCAKKGYVAVTAPDVLGYYQDLKDASKEYQRKIRTVIRGMTALARHPEVMNPFRFGFFSFQVVSHKLMRWLVPWFLIALFIVNVGLLADSVFYCVTFVAQIIFYCIAAAGHFSPKLRSNGVIKIVYFFVQVNLALLHAGCQFLMGKRMTVWQPSVR